jgi:hypothetical protein
MRVRAIAGHAGRHTGLRSTRGAATSAFLVDHSFEYAARAPCGIVRFDADFDALLGRETVEQFLHVGECNLAYR